MGEERVFFRWEPDSISHAIPSCTSGLVHVFEASPMSGVSFSVNVLTRVDGVDVPALGFFIVSCVIALGRVLESPCPRSVKSRRGRCLLLNLLLLGAGRASEFVYWLSADDNG